MINKIEKFILVTLSFTGAAYWGIGLSLTLMIPHEHPYYGKQPETTIYGMVMAFCVGVFLVNGTAIMKGRIRKRYFAWSLLPACIAVTMLLTWLEFTLNQP